jgi:3-methyladenine DNA glycosylase AlkD
MTLKKIRKRLQESADRNRAKDLQRYFKTGTGEYGEGDRFLGIRVPELRKLAKEFQELSLSKTKSLLQSCIHEERLLALLVMVYKFKKADEIDRKVIFELYMANTKYINNWDLVDVTAGHIIGSYLSDKDRQPIYDLAVSSVLWERRIAIMATSYFINQNRFDDTLQIAAMLLDDEDDLIHKAVGWMLREIGKREIDVEESFLKRHYPNMPRTMLRYAIERFPETRRQAYLQGRA